MNVALTDEMKNFVQEKVENGQYPSEEAVIEAAANDYATKTTRSERRHRRLEELIDHEFVEYCAS